MNLMTGKMSTAAKARHHGGWFAVFRGPGLLELWFGRRWVSVVFR